MVIITFLYFIIFNIYIYINKSENPKRDLFRIGFYGLEIINTYAKTETETYQNVSILYLYRYFYIKHIKFY